MRYNQLGRSGLLVSELCLGTMTFGDGAGVYANLGAVQVGEAEKLIGKAVDRGVNFLDSADAYAFGRSEEVTGQAIKNLAVRREDLVIATKVYHAMSKGVNDIGGTRKHIMDSVKGSL